MEQRSAQEAYERVDRQFRQLLEFDPRIERDDTCSGLKAILGELRQLLEKHNADTVQRRAETYHLAYNAIMYTLDVCKLLRRSEYAFESIEFLFVAVAAMEANLILQDAKYLDLRTKLYLELAHLYEEQDALQAATNILQTAIEKISELSAVHEADPPVPEHVSRIIQNNLRLVKIMLIKYRVQSGAIPAADWRKKVDEEFGTNAQAKLACLVECLRTRTSKQSNMFEDKKSSFKEALLNAGYQMVKADLQLLATALEQQKERIERIVAFKATENVTQELTNEEIKKRREFEDKLIKEKDYEKASQNVPLEYHCELLHYAYECRNQKIFQELAGWASVRIRCRRIEVKFITDVSILASTIPNPNIPNEYERLPWDLNEGNLRLELAKLRNSGRTEPASETKGEQAPAPVAKQPPKKGGKEPPKEEPKDKDASAPTKWQLEQIKHKYVYLLLKRSMNPDRAIYGIDIVMGHEQTGPVGYQDTRRIVVPYIQANASVRQSEVEQYTGVQTTTHLVPYIILYHSKNSLADQNEKRTVVTDVKPIFGKHPMVRPDLGYTKIPVDLRQVPQEFVRQKHHDYIYLSYKTDALFNVVQRHTQILIAFNDLEQTFRKSGGIATNTLEEKTLELDINYDLAKLDVFFETLEQSLRGVLGEDYYSKKLDFLTQMLGFVWVKYLRSPLAQFDYVNEQRLSGEIIDFDYDNYADVIARAKPIFARGLKILHLILLENPKADMILMCKLNLELTKLLEEEMDYRTAADNIRFCLNKLEERRNSYLQRGLESKFDKPLPLAITSSNTAIKETLESINDNFIKQREFINRQMRIRERSQKLQRRLTEAELKEEEFEFAEHQEKKDEPQLKDLMNCRHKEFHLLLMAMHLDLLNNLFRLELKDGDRQKKLELSKRKPTTNAMTKGLNASGFVEDEVEGLATSLKQKMGLMYSRSQTHNRKNLQELQSTLQKAGKLDPPNPSYSHYESKLFEEVNKNPYARALLLLNLAGNRPNEKKILLAECLKSIAKAKEEEKKMLDKAVENAIFIVSTLWDQKIGDKRSSQQFPFKQLYDGTWPSQSAAPTAPVLISKNANSISLKMPPQTLPPTEQSLLDPRLKKEVASMSIYGKISAHGVDVSTNCNELQGTGLREPVGTVMHVRQLLPNNHYCFACASTDTRDEQGPIGKTGEDIGTYNPLPISLLYCYLAKTAFQLGEYSLAKTAAFAVIDEICEVSNYLNASLSTNSLYYYKFRQSSLQSVSLLEVRWFAETLIVAARCLMKELEAEESEKKSVLSAVERRDRQDRIGNLLILSSLLSPIMPTPNQSLPFLLREQNIVQASMLLTSTPSKFMSPKLRMYAYKVMYGVLKWGLQNNEVALSRRIAYKWGERKWLMLGRVMKIEEKKEVKKGKDSKEQQVKIIDKYVKMLVEKSPDLADLYLDSGIALHEDYADYMSMFVERTKEQLNQLAQYVDNPPEELDKLTNDLNFKLEFIEYMKDPAASFTKVPVTSPFYLDSVCRLLRRAIELPADQKILQDSSQALAEPQPTPLIKISNDMQSLIQESIRGDIDWTPSNLKTLRLLQEKTGEDLSKEIQIFEKYIGLSLQLDKERHNESATVERHLKFDFVNQWLSELAMLKATVLISGLAATQRPNFSDAECFYNINFIDLEDLIKKTKEKEVVDKVSYIWNDKSLEQLEKIYKLLASSCYYSLQVENWTALQNAVKLAYNIVAYYWLTPFNHWRKPVWEHLALIALCSIELLKRVKANGYHEYRQRYQKQLALKQLSMVESKTSDGKKEGAVEFVSDEFPSVQPKLTTEVSKKFWFREVKEIDIELLANFLGYVVQTLRVEQKYKVLIGLVREYSNATQHRHSLLLLPFLIDAQDKLLAEAKKQLSEKQSTLATLTEKYESWRKTKKKSRQAELTGEKPKEQLEYEAESQQLSESIRLVDEKVSMLTGEQKLSRSIIDELRRDSNQAVLMQKEQRKILMDVGADEARMYRQDAEETKLSRNRKNTMLKELISKYSQIFRALKNSKTSKDSLSEIQNLHEIGNIYYAAGSLDKAEEFWNDALANILQTVNPITCFRDILSQKGPNIVSVVGLSETLLAINLLVKMSWVCFFKKLHLQREATEMAAQFLQAIFRIHPTHPQILRGFATYRLKALKDTDAFADQTTINLSQLINSCEYVGWGMIDQGEPMKCLPAATLMDYVSTDIVKHSVSSMKAKLIKSIALAEAGMIRESVSMLYRAAQDKDMPLLWIRQSEYVKRQRGSNWYPNDLPQYVNSTTFNDPNNKEVLENIKKLESVNKNFDACYGFTNSVLLQYAKAMIILSANESEVYESAEINEARCQNLMTAEAMMRECLKKLSFLEQFYQLLAQMKKAHGKWKTNEVDDALKKKKDETKAALVAYLKSQGIDEPNQAVYLNEDSNNDRRADRLALMARIRNSISRVNQARNMWTRSFYVVKYALFNLYRYSNDARQVETGFEKENDDSGAKQAPVGGKKDDKKGKKQVKEESKEQKRDVVIDEKKEEELRQMAEARKHRTTLCAYWHLRLEFELGRLLYRQNRFKQAIAVLTQLRLEAEIFQERYLFLMSEGYILRCRLKLGLYNPDQFETLINNLEGSHFTDQNFIDLVGDYAETCTDLNKQLKLLEKAKPYFQQIVFASGLQSYISSKDDNNRPVEYCLELQMSQQNEDEIKLKSKKAAGDPKKGGKDDKKAQKKDDPKKKREEVKADYKVQPLNSISWFNLKQEEKNTFQPIDKNNNSNELEFNCNHKLLPLFMKYSVRLAAARIDCCSITDSSSEAILSDSLKLVTVVESVIKRAQNVSTAIKYELLWLQGLAHKRIFLQKLHTFLNSHKDQTVGKVKEIKSNYEDLPLNTSCIQIPTFHEFTKTNKKLLEESIGYLKKLAQSLKGQCLVMEHNLHVEDVLWELADVCLLLAEYEGRLQPRHYQLPADLLQHQLTEAKIFRMNLLHEANKYVQYSAKINDCKRELSENYGEVGKKPFEPGATKLDMDILTEILEADYQYKKEYPNGLFDETKRKTQLSYGDILTYLNKLRREAQYMTYTNSQLQNNISKCHKFLMATLPTYKEKCTIASVEVAPKKDLSSTFVENGLVVIKSREQDGGLNTYLYILGGTNSHPNVKNNDEIIYGRVIDCIMQILVGRNELSKISAEFYQLKEKMLLSDAKSASQKQRDYKRHRQQFEDSLIKFAKMFLSSSGKQKDADPSLIRQAQLELNHELVDILIGILKERGAIVLSHPINTVLRLLHAIKYESDS